MSGAVAVLRREIAEHRLLLAGALLISLFPVLLPFLPGFEQSAGDVAEARGGAALILAGVLSTILALTLGATVLARDLSERRLGFYFSRPISGLAIWAGKILAALAVTVTAVAVVLLPVLLLGDLKSMDRFLGVAPLPLAVLWSGLLLLLLLAAHTVSSMVRSRTAWLLLDVAAAVVVAGLLLASYRRLVGEGAAFMVVQLLAIVFGAVFVLALLAANLLQILRGRTDLHRGHRWLSSVLWSLLLTGALATAGYSEWVLRAEPEDLRTLFQARSSPDGDWVYLTGRAGGRLGYEPSFLLEASSGRFVRIRLHPTFWHFNRLEFSADGRWAAWLEGGETASLVRVDLKDPELRTVRQVLRQVPGELALSPDGRHLALKMSDRLVVQETATERLIASVPLPPSEARIQFRDPGRLLLLRRDFQEDPTTVIEELDLASGKLSRLSAIPGNTWKSSLSPDGRRLLTSSSEGRGFRLYDVATGAELAQLQPPPNVGFTGEAAFLRDGRVVVSRWSYSGTELRIFDRDGARVLRTFRWPHYRDLQIGGELSGDRLLVILSERRYNRRDNRLKTVVLDLATGQSRPLGEGLLPLWDYSEEPGPVAPSLFFRPGRKELVRLDPATGELRKVLNLS